MVALWLLGFAALYMPAKCGYAKSSGLVCFCLLPAGLRGGRVVMGSLEELLPAGNVVSGVYIVYALFEYKKWIFSVYIVYAFFYFLPACLPARVCVW